MNEFRQPGFLSYNCGLHIQPPPLCHPAQLVFLGRMLKSPPACFVHLVCSVCLVHLVCLVFWLNETNQMNQINQINKTNQINQMDQTDQGCATRASRRGSRGPAKLFRSLLNTTGQQQNDQDQEDQA
jgi:hypothetical protein